MGSDGRVNTGSGVEGYARFAPLVLRIALGIVFILHGWPKLASPGGFAGFFDQIGIPLPSVMVLVVGVVETLGGLALILGKQTRIAAALLCIVMLGAIGFAKRSMGFLNGWEFDFVVLAACLSLVLSGPWGRGEG